MDNYSTIIKNLRKSKKLNQDDLANILGLKRHTICDWETGRTEPSIDSIIKLSQAFNVPAQYLLNARYTSLNQNLPFDEQNKYISFIPKSENEEQLLSIISSANSTQIKYLIDLLNICKNY
jgi:transcriptional regulator with XRE-family HTH domain